MATLLSKDHTILERKVMEFRPFGVDVDGKKIRDVSGITVRANVECLKELVGEIKGPEAGARAVGELVRLLNERIADSTYHVTPAFLDNIWHSYSYEFVCYLGEFCKVISGDSMFQARVGREKFISAVIQTLGRPFPLESIYRMFPHFGNKFSALSYGVAEVTTQSAVLTMQYPDSVSRQFGSYRLACAELICQSAKHGLAAVPEKVHRMPKATVRDLKCVARGDDRCEWELTWTPEPQYGFVQTIRSYFSPSALPVAIRELPASPAAVEVSAEEPRRPIELLSKEHRILERPLMEFRPFGVDEHGNKIRDISGAIVKANVDQLEDAIARVSGPQAGLQAVEDLCRLLNERIQDPAYHVTPAFLKNAWNSYSYEFVSFLREFCERLSGDPYFHYHVGQGKHLSPIIQALGRPFPMSQIFKLWPHFAQKFAKGSVICDASDLTNHSAVLRLKFTESSYRQFGPYRKACARLTCDASKGGISMVPSRVHNLPPATVRDRTCIVKGDEWCEWEVTWTPQPRQPFAWPASGLVASGGVFAYVRAFYPAMTLVESLGVALIPALVSWAATRLSLQARAAAREALIQEQVQVMEARHEELREVYLEQEQTQVELRQKVNQLTILHKQIEQLNVDLEGKVRERTAELERLNQMLQSANEQLQELDRLKSEFFANISHEFRTPLTLSLGSFKELWKLSPATKAREQINVGMRNTSRLLLLVNEFLDLAKFDRGALTIKKLSIDMAALVRAVAANFEASDRRRIHLRGANEPVPLEADPHQMKKVLYNLLANAVKFSDPATGEIWIRLGSKGDRVEIEVEDNGIGIPRDQLERIFERFAQVERSAMRRQEGTGIGLALVKEIVAQHGGTVTVESEPGRGSTFTVSLPRGHRRDHRGSRGRRLHAPSCL